ncbi:MAG TPA: DUF4159 domain-containing protein [Blastocatellia bacterium]|nr:DUF4159 domain-containing protein [Blastocatellia bacterium]
MNRKRAFISVMALLLLCGLALAQRSQRGFRKQHYEGPRRTDVPQNDQDLSGRFTFVRIRYTDLSSCTGFGPWLGDEGLPWSHDYPIAGRHLMKIMAELSKIDATLDVDEPIFTFDDPQLFKYPFAYLCEIGCMNLSEKELAGLREYILRGGFLLIDDFRNSWQFQVLQRQLKQALPEYEMKKMDISHPIFNCFFSIKTLDVNPVYPRETPEFWGMEDKDGRLMMIINYNYDVSDYWQFSDNPFRPIEETNDAYKFGVNYIMYAMTH